MSDSDHATRQLAAAVKRLSYLELQDSFDPFVKDSRPTPTQQVVLEEIKDYLFQYVQGGNQSGKSQLGGRVVSWFFLRNHPYLDINKTWPNEPIVILVIGRVSKQVEELWDKKIKPFLSPSEFKEQRVGGSIQSVTNPKNNSKIIFATHHQSNEAREKVQSYVVHFVWFDELTDNLRLIEELQRRAQSKRGRFMMTYTPKLRAPAVREFIEKETSVSKLYKISMMDNPIYAERKDELMEQIKNLPIEQQNTILYGDWYIGELAVYAFNELEHIAHNSRYDRYSWPHIISVDPAASGLMGYTLWSAPYSNAMLWYLVEAEYIKGKAPSDLVEAVESRASEDGKRAIIMRISDPHETWFIKEAQKLYGVHYGSPYSKNNRKSELITQVNESLGRRIKLLPEVTDAIDELATCQWKENNPTIMLNQHKFHLNDCIQYFVDCMPKFKANVERPTTFDSELHEANRKRILKEELARAKPGRRGKTKYKIVARRGMRRRRA